MGWNTISLRRAGHVGLRLTAIAIAVVGLHQPVANAAMALYAQGDVSGDGSIDSADVIVLSRHIRDGYPLDRNQIAAADVAPWGALGFEPDGQVTLADLLVLMRYVSRVYAPPPPTLDASLSILGSNPAVIKGSGQAGSLIRVYVNGEERGSVQLSSAATSFEVTVALDDGADEIRATAAKFGGESLPSNALTTTYSDLTNKSSPPLTVSNAAVWTSQGNSTPYQISSSLTISGANAALYLDRGSRVVVSGGSINVNSGARLVIYEGAEIEFNGTPTGRINVSGGGRVILQGTAEAPVRLTSGSPTPGHTDWGGIYVSGTGSTLSVDHVEIAHAAEPIRVYSGGTLLKLTNSWIHDGCLNDEATNAAVSADSATVGPIMFNLIEYSTTGEPIPTYPTGIALIKSRADLLGNEISGFNVGLRLNQGSADSYVAENDIIDNKTGVVVNGSGGVNPLPSAQDPYPTIEFNRILNNETNLDAGGFIHEGLSEPGPAWEQHEYRARVDARRNYWGSNDFVTISKSITDYNSQVTVPSSSNEWQFKLYPDVLFSPFLDDLGAEQTACVLGGFVRDTENPSAGSACYSRYGFAIAPGATFSIPEAVDVWIGAGPGSAIRVLDGANLVIAGTNDQVVTLHTGTSTTGNPTWGGFRSGGPSAVMDLDHFVVQQTGSNHVFDFNLGGRLNARHCVATAWSGGSIARFGSGTQLGSSIEYCEFVGVTASGTGYGFEVNGVSPLLKGNEISNFKQAIYLKNGASPAITGNFLHDNTQSAITIHYTGAVLGQTNPIIKFNTFLDNTINIKLEYPLSGEGTIDATENWFPTDASALTTPGENSLGAEEILAGIVFQVNVGSVRNSVDLSNYLAGAWVEGQDPSVTPSYWAPEAPLFAGTVADFAMSVLDSNGSVIAGRGSSYFKPRAPDSEKLKIELQVLGAQNVVVGVYLDDDRGPTFFSTPVWWQHVGPISPPQTISVEWDGKRLDSGALAAHEIYDVVVFKGSDATALTAGNVLYSRPLSFLPQPGAAAITITNRNTAFDAKKSDFYSSTIESPDQNARVGLYVNDGSASDLGGSRYPLRFPIQAGVATSLVWDGWVEKGSQPGLVFDRAATGPGDYLVASEIQWGVRGANIFLVDPPPRIVGSGSTEPAIGVRSNPYRVSRSYEQVSRLDFDIDQASDVVVIVYLPGRVEPGVTLPLTQLAITQGGVGVSGTLPAGAYTALWDWTGYETWQWNDGTPPWDWGMRGQQNYEVASEDGSVDGFFMVRIQATNPVTGLSNSFNGVIEVER